MGSYLAFSNSWGVVLSMPNRHPTQGTQGGCWDGTWQEQLRYDSPIIILRQDIYLNVLMKSIECFDEIAIFDDRNGRPRVNQDSDSMI